MVVAVTEIFDIVHLRRLKEDHIRRLYAPPSSGGTGERSQVECAKLTPNRPSRPSLYTHNSQGLKPDLSNGPTIVGSPLSLC